MARARSPWGLRDRDRRCGRRRRGGSAATMVRTSSRFCCCSAVLWRRGGAVVRPWLDLARTMRGRRARGAARRRSSWPRVRATSRSRRTLGPRWHGEAPRRGRGAGEVGARLLVPHCLTRTTGLGMGERVAAAPWGREQGRRRQRFYSRALGLRASMAAARRPCLGWDAWRASARTPRWRGRRGRGREQEGAAAASWKAGRAS